MATFGYDTIGGTTNANGSNSEVVFKYALAATADVTKISIYADGSPSGAAMIKGIIYSDSGSSHPDVLKGATNEGSIAAGAGAGWVDLTFASAVRLTPGDYWIGWHCGGTTNWHSYYDAGGTGTFKAQTYASGQLDPWGSDTNSLTQKTSITATYTTVGGQVLAMQTHIMGHGYW